MARGSFLVSKAAARALIDQKLGGDIRSSQGSQITRMEKLL